MDKNPRKKGQNMGEKTREKQARKVEKSKERNFKNLQLLINNG